MMDTIMVVLLEILLGLAIGSIIASAFILRDIKSDLEEIRKVMKRGQNERR